MRVPNRFEEFEKEVRRMNRGETYIYGGSSGRYVEFTRSWGLSGILVSFVDDRGEISRKVDFSPSAHTDRTKEVLSEAFEWAH